MENTVNENNTLIELTDEELDQVTGGVNTVRRFQCPHCGQMTMVIKFKSLKCTNPNCSYTRRM